MSIDKDWGASPLLASRKIKAGTRYYYIDAKLDSKGNKYLVLSETKLKESEGKLERHRIFIYEEDFAKVMQALLETIQEVSDLPTTTPSTTQVEHQEELPETEDLRLEAIDLDWGEDEEA